MNKLSPNWITEKHIDFEYKKYLLLAYLTEVNNHFENNILYPCFSEVIEHYKNVTSLKKHKKFIEESFPVKMNKLDIKNLNLEYERLITDDALMQEVEHIIDYSIPKFEHYLNEGKKIFDFIEEQISLMPIGLVPLNANYGYLFLKSGDYTGTRIYEYQVTLFETPDEKYRGIHTLYIESFTSCFTTYESIKSEMIRKNRSMPNPATYAIETGLSLPLNETFLPVAKRLLVKHLSENAAN